MKKIIRKVLNESFEAELEHIETKAKKMADELAVENQSYADFYEQGFISGALWAKKLFN